MGAALSFYHLLLSESGINKPANAHFDLLVESEYLYLFGSPAVAFPAPSPLEMRVSSKYLPCVTFSYKLGAEPGMGVHIIPALGKIEAEESSPQNSRQAWTL